MFWVIFTYILLVEYRIIIQKLLSKVYKVIQKDDKVKLLYKLKNHTFKRYGFLVYIIIDYAFLTTEDFNFIAPNPSILHSISCPSAASGTKRIFFTFVPIFIDDDAPFTLRSLTTVTESPSFN